ncbi:uracil-DNA glycosylase family protein [Dokdonella soli]|uniref:Uracil-DNA glycosylase family protein n=1 Tax=Dokdonella soli TaxID=529810 RepID=A0ABN1IL69_9GAMM
MKPHGGVAPLPIHDDRERASTRVRSSRAHAALKPVDAERDLATLLAAIRACRVCEAQLPLGPRPIVQAEASARLLIVGQAPGAKVHASGVPWDDASGARLRDWLGIDKALFYDAAQVAIVPMGYCYPGRGRGGDLPPRRECAQLWLDALLARLPHIELTLLIGQYAQRHFLGAANKANLTDTVAAFADYAPRFIPLPHPSPRNTGWFKRHPWFARELLPMLRERVHALLAPATNAARA